MENNAWLRAEIAQWVREGLINDAQARTLYDRYPNQAPVHHGDGGWGRLIFAALGAVIFGLGIILFFAYNWAEMHRYTKLAIIVGGMVSSYLAAALLRARDVGSRIAESLFLLGSMIFGAGIWLIAQIYHLDIYYPQAFLMWMLLSLAMAWALPSQAQGMLASVLLLLWCGLETLELQRLQLWSLLIICIGLLPLAYHLRSLVLLAISLIVLPVCLVMNGGRFDDGWKLIHFAQLASLYLLAERFAIWFAWREMLPALYQLGLAAWLLAMLLFSSGEASWQFNYLTGVGFELYGVTALALMAGWAWLLSHSQLRPRSWVQSTETALILLPLLALMLLPFNWVASGVMVTLANFSLLGLALLLIYRGTEHVQLKTLIAGCLVLAILCFARFQDLFHSLLARSSIFLLLGLTLFVVGLRYARQSERRKLERPRRA